MNQLPILGTPSGRPGTFCWDSADVGGDDVFFRATPFDTEIGIPSETNRPKTVRRQLDREFTLVGDGFELLEVVDIDSDGDLDLVVEGDDGETPGVFAMLQDTPGSFAAPSLVVPYEVGRPFFNVPSGVEIADIDQNGRRDLLLTYTEELVLWWGEADGSYTRQALSVLEPNISSRYAVATDVDGDGVLDVCWVSVERSFGLKDIFVTVQPHLGGRDLSAPRVRLAETILDINSSQPRVQRLSLLDVDDDGRRDVVCEIDSRLYFLWNDPRGYTVGGGRIDPDTTFVDVDLDGDLDLVSSANARAQTAPRQFDWLGDTYVGVTDWDQDGEPDWVVQGTALSTPYATVRDVDGDGDVDLIGKLFLSEGVQLFLQPNVEELVESNVSSTEVKDVDFDGDLDRRSYETLGPRVFGELVPGTFGQIVDVDGNGFMDFAYAANYPASQPKDKVVARYRSSGGVTQEVTLAEHPLVNNVASLAFVDVVGDARLDLVAANATRDNTRVFEQLPDGTFGNPQRLRLPGVVDRPWDLVVEDLDHDGDVDVASVNRDSGNVTVFRQEGGVFEGGGESPEIIGEGLVLDPTSIVSADIDGDGDLDLVFGGQGLAVFFQQDGFFPNGVLLDEDGLWERVAVADMDGNGLPDIVGSNRILFQGQHGAFTHSRQFSGDAYGVADFDHDGDLDVFGTNVHWGGQ